MADAKQEKDKKKDATSEGTGFKTVMGGFDKNEVNLYINKLKKQMKEQMEEYEKRIGNLQTNLEDANKEAQKAKAEKKTAEHAAEEASAPIIKDSSAETKKLIDDLKAESDKKIMELRKSVLDERRNVAKFDKECAMAKMSEKKVREEYDKLKEKYLSLKKSGGGKSAGTPKTTSNADEVMAEAAAYAKDIIEAAKKYADQAVKAADKYKADVEAELKERSKKLDDVKTKLSEQIKKTEKEQAESSKKVKEISEKIGALTSLFDSFTSQFDSVNSQISDVTENISSVCKQFNETSGQMSSVSKQISEATDLIGKTSQKMTETNDLIGKTSEQLSGFSDQLDGTKSDIEKISELVTDTKSKVDDAKSSVSDAQSAANEQTSAADLSPIAKIGEEISGAFGAITAKLDMPKFDESKFSTAKFDEIKKKFKFETTYEGGDSEAPSDDEEEFLDDSNIISSLEIDAPDTSLPSDEDLMADVPDVITAPKFIEDEPAKKAAAPAKSSKSAKEPEPVEDKSEKTERPGLDSDFEDFFMTEPKDDDMSGDIPLINMEGVGIVDDFSLDTAPEPMDPDFDITPLDKTAKPDKGDDLGSDIFDMALDPVGADDNTLADMMADADKAAKTANKDLTPEDMGFNAEDTLPTGPSDDFGEFADLFAQGSTQTSSQSDNKKPVFKKSNNDDNGDNSDFGELSDLLI